MENKNDFEFKYSAPTTVERREIESIRSHYVTQKRVDVKLERIRKLDGKVKGIPGMIALIIGFLGFLIFGLGMSMILEWKLIVSGIIVGTVGLAGMIVAHPVYTKVYTNLKNKYGEEILKLSEELLNDEDASL